MDPQSQAHPAVHETSEVAGTNLNQRADAKDSQRLQHPRIGTDRTVDPRSRTSEDKWTPDSHNNHQSNVTEEDAITAADIPLPESIQTSSRQSLSDIPETVGNQAEAEYWDYMQAIEEGEPRLGNVGKQSRAHDRASFELLDYSNGNLITTETHLLGSTTSRAVEDFTAAILNDVRANTDARLLVVEDLSSGLIHVLHTCLGVSLEFFEEHLLNAGWHSNDYYRDEPARWNAGSDFIKDYVSVKWLRPIQAKVLRSSGGLTLHPLWTPDKWEEKISDRSRISHSTQPLVNILRRPWKAKLRHGGGVATWEERASVWSTQLGQCRTIVLLLDPMPVIRHTQVNVKLERYSQGRPQVQSRHRERVLPSSEELEDQDLENGRSHFRISIPSVSWFAQLLPRVFQFGTSGRMNDEAIPPAESRRESGSRRSAQGSVREDSQLAESYKDHCMFIGFSVRVPLTIYSDTIIPENKQRLAREMRCYSTINTLKQLLEPHEVPVPHRSTPLESLLQIIVYDTFKILQFIGHALNDMDLKMLDDMLVQMQIDDWRRILHDFDTELRTMESSIPDFADFVLVTQRRDSHAAAIHELLGRFKKQVTKVQGRTESTHRSLMATMSLIESKRGISEAESVTKLTEWAFFFIPLTFTATLFSMQVKELDGSTSVSFFVAVALAITICSYGLRLVIRSSRFFSIWRRWGKVIRVKQGIQRSSPIATSAVLSWVWQRVHTHILPVYIVIAMATLLAALWTRPLREGMKIGITTALAMICLTVVLRMFTIRYRISENWVRRHRQRLRR